MGCSQVPPAHLDRLTDIQLNVVVAGGDDVHPVEHDEHNGTVGQEDVVSKPCPRVLHLQLEQGLLAPIAITETVLLLSRNLPDMPNPCCSGE